MKKLLISLLVITGCSLGGIVDLGTPTKFTASSECKQVVAKVLVKNVTGDRFHLMAADGSYVEVEIGKFYSVPVGDCYSSTGWQKGATAQ